MTEEKKVENSLTGCIIICIVCPIFSGWCLTHLWCWFIVPFGLPQITIAWAIGLTCVVGMFRNFNSDSPTREWHRILCDVVFFSGVMLSLGYLAHRNM